MMHPSEFYALVGSPFGDSPDYIGHTGTDFPWGPWTEIPSFGRGRVVAKGHNSIHGNWVSIIIGSTYFHFCHMVIESPLEVGQLVEFGDLIGYVGATGDVTGAHLHLAASNQPTPGTGNRVDPLPLVRAFIAAYFTAVAAGLGNIPIEGKRKVRTMTVGFLKEKGTEGVFSIDLDDPQKPLRHVQWGEYAAAAASGAGVAEIAAGDFQAQMRERGVYQQDATGRLVTTSEYAGNKTNIIDVGGFAVYRPN